MHCGIGINAVFEGWRDEMWEEGDVYLESTAIEVDFGQ